MARENSLQAPHASGTGKQDVAPANSEETPDTKSHLPAGGKQASDGGHADDRSGSD
jgi:hypothetical protein